MLEFLNEQINEVQEELKDLYRKRRNAGIESRGGYENRIAMLKKELGELQKEAAAEMQQNKPTVKPPSSKTRKQITENEKNELLTLVYAGETAAAVQKILLFSDDKKLLLAAANFQQHHDKYTMGQLSYSDYAVAGNRMNEVLLTFLNSL